MAAVSVIEVGPRGLPNARPWMAGQDDPKPVMLRHGWQQFL
jgi:hypothetical protein